jgi:signal transduction histidine kinase
MTRAAFGRLTLVLMAIAFVVLLALGGAMIWLVQQTRGYAAGVAATQEMRLATGRVLTMLADAETGQRGFLLTGEERYLAPYHAAVAALPDALAELAGLVQREDERLDAPTRLRLLAARKLSEIRETLDLVRLGQRATALSVVETDHGRALMEEIRDLAAAIDGRSADRSAARSAALDRAVRWLLIGSGAGVLLIGGVAIGSVAIAFRYTRELERAQAEVKAANDALEQRVAERTADLAAANDELQRFAYIVSHDLRAPLVNVMGFTAELEEATVPLRGLLATLGNDAAPCPTRAAAEAAVREEIPEALGFIRSSTQRMDRLISAILRLSREGRRQLVPERVQMGALISSIAGTMQHQLDEAGCSLNIEGRLPDIVSDRLALEQIFANLIDNAVKYLGPERERPGRITVRGRLIARGRAVFEVEDNGRGVDPRDHDRIFELFRRAGSQDQPGEGIGLAHVRALARRLGGNVEIASALAQGSVFRVTLPVVLDAQPAPAPEDTSR